MMFLNSDTGWEALRQTEELGRIVVNCHIAKFRISSLPTVTTGKPFANAPLA